MLSIKRHLALIMLLMITAFLQISCSQNKSEGNIIILTENNFNSTKSEGLVLVDYWATWCKPCQVQGPIVAKIAEQFKGKLTVGKCDVDKNRDIAATYNIQAIPTLILFKDGHPVETMTGLQSKSSLEEVIGKYLKQ